jgi:hypothetical protein
LQFPSYSAVPTSGFDNALEDFQLLIEPGDFEDLAIGRVGRGDLDVSLLLVELVLDVQQHGQPITVKCFGVVQV